MNRSRLLEDWVTQVVLDEILDLKDKTDPMAFYVSLHDAFLADVQAASKAVLKRALNVKESPE